MSKQSYRVCFCFRRIFRVGTAEPPDDVKRVFNDYSENGTMSLDHLHRFLIEYQKEVNATKENAQNIFNSLRHLNIFQRRGLHLEAFFRFLLGDLNTSLPPYPKVHHDMNAPLAHYFLYTGHNSYLTGNQLSSDCSVEPIIRALGRGVRVIELDLWPNATEDDVIVCHGGTLTTPVALIKCLQAIKDHAFIASEYPVVITFEDHLDPGLQSKVAQMVSTTFGDALFYPESELKELPSPESLKKKIMISTKPPKKYLESQHTKEKGPKAKGSAEEEHWENENEAVINGTEIDDKDESDEGEDHQDEDMQNRAPEYSRLIAIHAGKKKGEIEDWISVDPTKVGRISLSEQDLEKATRTHGPQIVRFTQRNLLRVYPKGTRVTSTNYNPLVGWTHGAQMVAFNMQGYGKYLWIMHGMFRANGGCGYVKKPDFLLNSSLNNNGVLGPGATLSTKTTTLKVKVYMGEGWRSDFKHTHFDLYSPPDFYARVGIAGVEADESIMKETKPIEDEWVPVWNAEFEFQLTVPELALLRIEVLEYDTSGKKDFAGQTCLPVLELRPGIRAVPLHNRRGEKYKSVRLLMGFEFR